MSSKKYRFSCTLKGHDADVRGLCNSVHENGGMLSCSRDKTSKLWIPENNAANYESKNSYIGHRKFVSCIAAMGPIKGIYPYGIILTGGNDKIINVYSPYDEVPLMSLSGHENVVSNIKCGSHGMFYSSSWDQTARMWQLDLSQVNSADCINVLSGHAAAVWDIAVLPGKQIILTASADKTIRSWEAGGTICIYTGHNDCVRGLAVISSSQFLSCSNDATVKRWDVTGDCLQTYYGHKSYVYSIDLLVDAGMFVTSGEDQTVKVWALSSSNPEQTLPVPALSAWKVIALTNGDLAVGCSDGSVRVFSHSSDRMASEVERAVYEEELAKLALPEEGLNLGSINQNELRGPEALQQRGQTDGQTLMIKNASVVEAYQWSSVEDKWVKVGDVVGSSGSNKSTYMGKEYDYVFTVDILEGAPPLHLPYNLDQDPWFAAQKFIDDNDLSQQFLDTVASFIIDNTKKNNAVQAPTSGYSDPFTGQGRYMPTNPDPGKSSGGFDPFTGGGRYVPGSSSNKNGLQNSGKRSDPMVNPSRYIPSGDDDKSAQQVASSKVQGTPNNYFPKCGYILFETKNIDSMFKKLSSNSAQTANPLSQDDVANMQALVKPAADREAFGKGIETMWKVLLWDSSLVLPALDLLRCALVVQKQFFEIACEGRIRDLQAILLSHLQPQSINNNTLLAVRILCNLFSSFKGKEFLYNSFDAIMASIKKLASADEINSNVGVAISTLFVNFAVSFNERSAENIDLFQTLRLHCVDLCALYFERQLSTEAFFRLLVAVGTLLYGHETAQNKANKIKLKQLILRGTDAHSNSQKVAECISLVVELVL